MAYRSQYANQPAGSALFVPEEEIRERTFAEARHYGLLAGVRYGEPFVQKEVDLVDDLTLLPVQTLYNGIQVLAMKFQASNASLRTVPARSPNSSCFDILCKLFVDRDRVEWLCLMFPC
jgi:hypothetical protein